MESKHTPTPWLIDGTLIIGDIRKHIEEYTGENEGLVICDVNPDTEYNIPEVTVMQANAAYIIKCVNAHDELVKALNEWLLVVNRTPAALHHYGDAIKNTEAILSKLKQD